MINKIKEIQVMAKRLEERLSNNKLFKELVNRPLSDSEVQELYKFHDLIGYNADRIRNLVQFILLGYTDWVGTWNKLKEIRSGTKEHFCLLYGNTEGEIKYTEVCVKKTKGFDHSSDIQREKGLKSAKLSRGSKEWSVRSMGYWIKKGLTEEEAYKKVQEIQSTNCLKKYINKYGEQEGITKFNHRKQSWTEKMNDPEIGRKRSLGLSRYIERYGEVEGKRVYTEMRLERNRNCRIGKASKESLTAFNNLLYILETNNIKYYLGVEGNKEWFIYNKELEKMFFYDLTIPRLGIIIEYHGEGFHPNPKWDENKLTEWKQVRTGKSTNEILEYTEQKNNTARDNGWTVYEVYSSEASKTVHNLEILISKLIHS
jgi:hypothetical protein